MNLFQLGSRKILFGFVLLLLGIVCALVALAIADFDVLKLIHNAGTWYAPIGMRG